MFDESEAGVTGWDNLSKIGIIAEFEVSGIRSIGFVIKNKEFKASSDVSLIKGQLKEAAKTSSKQRAIKFLNCIFNGVDLSEVDFHLEFIDCEFKESIQLETIHVIKMSDCAFKSSVRLRGLHEVLSQLELNKVTFFEKVKIENYMLRDIEDRPLNTGIIKSVFRNVVFCKELTLDDVFFPMDIVYEGVSLPKNIVSDRATLKRLKGVMEHQHNYIDAAFFHSLELNEYRKELNNKTWKEAFEDKILFGVNWYASKFSLSWGIPLYWIVILSMTFYGAAMCCDTEIAFSWNTFAQFMNPFSWNSKEFGSVYAIWFLHKIFVVPLVYLMVVALKRKTKL